MLAESSTYITTYQPICPTFIPLALLFSPSIHILSSLLSYLLIYIHTELNAYRLENSPDLSEIRLAATLNVSGSARSPRATKCVSPRVNPPCARLLVRISSPLSAK